MRNSVLALALLWLVLAPACRSARRPIDWDQARSEGRVEQDNEALRHVADDPQHFWSDGGAQVLVVEEGGGLARNRRLIIKGYGRDRVETPFLLDTGASGSMLSSSSPLGREVTLFEKSRFQVLQGNKRQGHMGSLPELHFGTMSRQDVVVGVVESEHSLERPANVLGLPDFFHAQLEHNQGRWFLRSQANRLTPRPAGWANVSMVPGYALVTLHDPHGREVYGLLDTGAPTSYAVTPAPRGAYDVRADDGSTALRIPVQRTIAWRGLNIHGRKVSVLIGMDALSAREGRFTFNQAVWSLAPAP